MKDARQIIADASDIAVVKLLLELGMDTSALRDILLDTVDNLNWSTQELQEALNRQ